MAKLTPAERKARYERQLATKRARRLQGVPPQRVIIKLVRILVLLQRRRGVTLIEMQEELNVDLRTVQRYLQGIEEAGLFIERVDADDEPVEKQSAGKVLGNVMRYRAFGRWDLRAIPAPKESP